jgi:hypothetical protein
MRSFRDLSADHDKYVLKATTDIPLADIWYIFVLATAFADRIAKVYSFVNNGANYDVDLETCESLKESEFNIMIDIQTEQLSFIRRFQFVNALHFTRRTFDEWVKIKTSQYPSGFLSPVHARTDIIIWATLFFVKTDVSRSNLNNAGKFFFTDYAVDDFKKNCLGRMSALVSSYYDELFDIVDKLPENNPSKKQMMENLEVGWYLFRKKYFLFPEITLPIDYFDKTDFKSVKF